MTRPRRPNIVFDCRVGALVSIHRALRSFIRLQSRLPGVREVQLGGRCQNAATAETTEYVRAFRRAFDLSRDVAWLSGLMSGASNISCSCSRSPMMRMSVEALVSLFAAWRAGSPALLAFDRDSALGSAVAM
jgi:hypothetical protein